MSTRWRQSPCFGATTWSWWFSSFFSGRSFWCRAWSASRTAAARDGWQSSRQKRPSPSSRSSKHTGPGSTTCSRTTTLKTCLQMLQRRQRRLNRLRVAPTACTFSNGASRSRTSRASWGRWEIAKAKWEKLPRPTAPAVSPFRKAQRPNLEHREALTRLQAWKIRRKHAARTTRLVSLLHRASTTRISCIRNASCSGCRRMTAALSATNWWRRISRRTRSASCSRLAPLPGFSSSTNSLTKTSSQNYW